MEFKHEFFGFNPYGTWPPSEYLDARIATALRHMAAKVGRTGGASPEQRQPRQRASRRLDYLAAQGIDMRQGCTMDLGRALASSRKRPSVVGQTSWPSGLCSLSQ